MTATETNHIVCSNCQSHNHTHFAKTADMEYFTGNREYDFYHCNNCDVIFIYPQPLNKLETIYPKNYYSFNNNPKGLSFRIKYRLDRLFLKKKLRNLSQNELHVLDIGGGTGWLCDIIKKADSRVIETQIIDIDQQAQHTAEQKGHRFFCGLIEQFEHSGNYDVILLLNLIEHVANPQAVLLKAKELLAPNGIIIIQTPNHRSLDARLFRNTYWGGLHCPRHWIIFSKHSFLSLANKCGLQVQQFRYTQGAAFWAVSVLHLLRKWNLVKAGATAPLVYHPAFSFISMLAAGFDFVRKPFAPLSQMQVILKHPEK